MTGDKPFVSVVVPHLNQLEAADRCLHSLYAQSYPRDRFEIIVVDNGSSCDLTPLAAAHPDVTFLKELTPGPGPARNKGVQASRGDIVAFTDADCRVDPEWLVEAVALLMSGDSSGVVGGDVRIDFVDARRLTAIEAYEAVFAYRQKLYIEQRGFSGAGNLAVRRSVFDAVGGFGGIEISEDMDWGVRAARARHPARYAPRMIVFHPARTRMAELEAKWRRHVAHDLAEHRRYGGLRWGLRALAALASIVPHTLKLLTSDRLGGLGNRLRGVQALVAIRIFRFREMAAQWRADEPSAAARWNRGAV